MWGSQNAGYEEWGFVGWTVVQFGERVLSLLTASPVFWLGLLFDPEDGGDMFFPNAGLSPNCKELQPTEAV
jgi:hypothetical protein